MDKIINKHIDGIEALSDEMGKVVEQEISQLDIDGLIDNPVITLTQAVDNMRDIFMDEYATRAITLGISFGEAINKRIEQDKAIKVDASNDPNLNAKSDDNK